MTGNGGGNVNDDDVDDGTTILSSPTFDLTTFTNPYINYSRWFFEQFSTNPEQMIPCLSLSLMVLQHNR